MERKKSLLSKMILSVVLPVAVIFFIMAWTSLYMMNQNADQNNLILIFGVGLIIIIGIMVLGIKGVSNKISSLTEIAGQLVNGDVDGEINVSATASNDEL